MSIAAFSVCLCLLWALVVGKGFEHMDPQYLRAWERLLGRPLSRFDYPTINRASLLSSRRGPLCHLHFGLDPAHSTFDDCIQLTRLFPSAKSVQSSRIRLQRSSQPMLCPVSATPFLSVEIVIILFQLRSLQASERLALHRFYQDMFSLRSLLPSSDSQAHALFNEVCRQRLFLLS